MSGKISNTAAALILIVIGLAIIGGGAALLLWVSTTPVADQETTSRFLQSIRPITKPIVGFVGMAGLSAIGIGVRYLLMSSETETETPVQPFTKPELGDYQRPMF